VTARASVSRSFPQSDDAAGVGVGRRPRAGHHGAPPAPRTPVRIGGNIQAPILLHRADPAYPDIAVVAKVAGMVILEATVGVDGAVESVRLLRGIKFLDQAAMDAVKQWRYSSCRPP